MRSESGKTTSLWHATAGELTRDGLGEDARADVCVVGAGIAGMMTAYLLAQAGRRVLVLDDGPIGGGETGRTTAHVSDALDDRYAELERLHGAEGARLAAASHRAAIGKIAEISRAEQIDCNFAWLDGYLYPSSSTAKHRLEHELDAARRAGAAAELVENAPYALFGGRRALKFPQQARMHVLKLLDGLARCIERDGGRIHTGTHVDSIEGGAPVRVKTSDGHTVLASACVVATNSPISDYVVTHAKQAPYRTFAIAARVPHGSVPDALYWEDADPYTYVRLQPGETHDWLIVGGEDYKTGQKEDDAERLQRLVTWTRENFPGVEAIDYQWSGQVLEPSDGLGFIGPNPDGAENVYIITGDSGHGMTHGTLGAMLISDMIQDQPNEWAKLYDPKRIRVRAAGDLAKENLNVAAQYAAWVLPGDAASEEDVPSGSGRVVRRGTHMIACYRDEDGTLHERSAVCTHLKCIVNWNDLEKSWDCPCHGSRFGPLGEVLNGPALSPLQDVE